MDLGIQGGSCSPLIPRGVHACICVQSLRPFLTFCDPMDCSLPGSSVHGILQAKILEWVPVSSPGDLPDPGIEPGSPMSLALSGRFLTTGATWEKPFHNV